MNVANHSLFLPAVSVDDACGPPDYSSDSSVDLTDDDAVFVAPSLMDISGHSCSSPIIPDDDGPPSYSPESSVDPADNASSNSDGSDDSSEVAASDSDVGPVWSVELPRDFPWMNGFLVNCFFRLGAHAPAPLAVDAPDPSLVASSSSVLVLPARSASPSLVISLTVRNCEETQPDPALHIHFDPESYYPPGYAGGQSCSQQARFLAERFNTAAYFDFLSERTGPRGLPADYCPWPSWNADMSSWVGPLSELPEYRRAPPDALKYVHTQYAHIRNILLVMQKQIVFVTALYQEQWRDEDREPRFPGSFIHNSPARVYLQDPEPSSSFPKCLFYSDVFPRGFTEREWLDGLLLEQIVLALDYLTFYYRESMWQRCAEPGSTRQHWSHSFGGALLPTDCSYEDWIAARSAFFPQSILDTEFARCYVLFHRLRRVLLKHDGDALCWNFTSSKDDLVIPCPYEHHPAYPPIPGGRLSFLNYLVPDYFEPST